MDCRFPDVDKRAGCSLGSSWDQASVKVRPGKQGWAERAKVEL